MSTLRNDFTKGIITQNPIFVMALGLCPALAVSTSVDNALGMSAAVVFVLLFSNLIVSAIRKIVPETVRFPTYIIIIATFVTIINMIFQAYLPNLYDSLGIYLPLIVTYCIILGRAEAFASKKPILSSLMDALGIGIGFALALVIISFIRELLGTGGITLFDKNLFTIPGFSDNPVSVFILPAGAFLTIGLLLALFKRLGVIKE